MVRMIPLLVIDFLRKSRARRSRAWKKKKLGARKAIDRPIESRRDTQREHACNAWGRWILYSQRIAVSLGHHAARPRPEVVRFPRFALARKGRFSRGENASTSKPPSVPAIMILRRTERAIKLARKIRRNRRDSCPHILIHADPSLSARPVFQVELKVARRSPRD